MRSVLRLARERADLVALAAMAVCVPVLSSQVPAAIWGIGAVSGSALALHAAGLVLVYRSDRIVNFAQVQVGVVAAVLFRLLVEQRTLVRAARAVCGPCIRRETETVLAVAYWVALGVSLVAAIGLSYLVYTFVIRRFRNAPRLVLTVATIGVAQLLASIHAWLPGLLATERQRELSQLPQGAAAAPPADIAIRWGPAVFRIADVLTVVLAVAFLAGLFVSLRYSRRGMAIRAAADNAERASTLGIDVDATARRVWVLAGGLSGVAALLAAMSSPAGAPSPIDVSLTVRILAALVIARMVSIPLAAAAAVLVGSLDQAALWIFRSTAPVDGMLAAAIAVVLLLQRARQSRAEIDLAASWRAAREAMPTPAVLRELGPVKRWRRSMVGGGVALIVAFPWIMSPTQTDTSSLTFIFAIVGLSLLVLSGWAGQISLGHFAIAGIGGVVTSFASASLGIPFVVCLVLSMIAGAILAIIVGIPALRLPGLHLAIVTLALSLAASSLLFSPSFAGEAIPDAVERGSLLGVGLEDERAFFYVVLVVLSLVVTAVVGLRRSRIGRMLIAARDNEGAAQSFGIDAVRGRLIAFAFSGALASLAGSMFVFHQHGLRSASFTPDVSIAMFLMTVIGGLGSIAGPLIGAAYLGVLTLFSASPLVVSVATGGGVVLLLLLAPGGLSQLAYDIRDVALRRIARRHGIVAHSLGEQHGRTRAPIAPKTQAGTEVFVPKRYRLDPVGVEKPR